MNRISWQLVAILLGSALMAAFSVVVALLDLHILALIVPLALIGGVMIVLRPYFAVWFIAFFTQLDAVMAAMFGELPVIKLLTAAAVAGILMTGFRQPFRTRWGGDEPILRLAAMFALVLLLTSLFAKDLELAFWSVRRLGSLVVLLYLTVFLVRTMPLVKSLVFAIVVSTLLSSMILLGDFTLGAQLVASSHAALEAEYMGMSRSSGGRGDSSSSTSSATSSWPSWSG